MDDRGVYPGLDQYITLGKSIKEKKSKIESELSSLQKRILDLQRQRRLAYRNSVKVKKTIHNQINQIVKCLRSREHYLLSKVDEAYMCEDTNYDTQLSVLQSREIRARELYSNLENFKEKRDTMKKISNILEEANHFEKRTFRPLQFISNFESVKETAHSYGCLEGEFIEMDFPKEDFGHSPNSDGQICPVFIMDKELHIDSDYEGAKKKLKRRERTESQDSFEIIDLLDNMNCEDFNNIVCESETDISTSANCSPNFEKLSNVADCPKDSSVLSDTQPLQSGENIAEENEKEKKHEAPLQGFLSKHCFQRSYEERICNLTQQTLKYSAQKKNNGIYHRNSVATDTKSWLQNNKNPYPSNIHVMDIDSNSEKNNSKMSVAQSQVDSVKRAFATFLTKDRIENWLSN